MVNNKISLVSLVAIFALAISLIASASAFVPTVEVSGVSNDNIAVFAGQTIPVRIIFTADSNANDTRVKVWISGESAYAVSTDRFDVIDGKTYSKLLSVQIPSKVDPSEDLKLEVLVESRNSGELGAETISLSAQRESYALDVLDAIMDSEVKAGSTLTVDLVLKNVGRQLSEDTFVKVRIPALGIEKKAYFGDLSAVDQSNPDKEDAAEKMMTLSIPSNAPAGVYLVEIEAYDADSTATATKKVSITGGAGDSSVFVASANSKTFAVGEKAEYSLTLVNSGDKIRVFELVPETSSTLAVDLSDQTVVVPAGQSKTVTLDATASKEGKYDFAVNIYSDSELV